jgi:hypothetical protein
VLTVAWPVRDQIASGRLRIVRHVLAESPGRGRRRRRRPQAGRLTPQSQIRQSRTRSPVRFRLMVDDPVSPDPSRFDRRGMSWGTHRYAQIRRSGTDAASSVSGVRWHRALADRMATTSTARSLGVRARRALGRGERHRGRGLRPREYGPPGRRRTSDRSSDTPARSPEPCPCT